MANYLPNLVYPAATPLPIVVYGHPNQELGVELVFAFGANQSEYDLLAYRAGKPNYYGQSSLLRTSAPPAGSRQIDLFRTGTPLNFTATIIPLFRTALYTYLTQAIPIFRTSIPLDFAPYMIGMSRSAVKFWLATLRADRPALPIDADQAEIPVPRISASMGMWVGFDGSGGGINIVNTRGESGQMWPRGKR
jgi:hypothetical protein